MAYIQQLPNDIIPKETSTEFRVQSVARCIRFFNPFTKLTQQNKIGIFSKEIKTFNAFCVCFGFFTWHQLPSSMPSRAHWCYVPMHVYLHCVYVFVFLPGISCHYLDCYVCTSFTNMHRILMGEKTYKTRTLGTPFRNRHRILSRIYAQNSVTNMKFCHEYLYEQNSVTNMIGIVMGQKNSTRPRQQCETAYRGIYPIFAAGGGQKHSFEAL